MRSINSFGASSVDTRDEVGADEHAVEARRPRDRTSTLFVLQRYVPNEGDAWQVTIDQAQDFFERVLVAPFAGRPHPRLDPLSLASAPLPDIAQQLLRDFFQ